MAQLSLMFHPQTSESRIHNSHYWAGAARPAHGTEYLSRDRLRDSPIKSRHLGLKSAPSRRSPLVGTCQIALIFRELSL